MIRRSEIPGYLSTYLWLERIRVAVAFVAGLCAGATFF